MPSMVSRGIRAAVWGVCLAVGCVVVHAGDWREFRGPTGQGHSLAKGLPLTWSTTENVTWRVDVEGKGWASPVLLDGKLYLATAVPKSDEPTAAQTLRAVCLDAATGKQLWQRDLFEQPEGQKIHGKNSHASATPVTDGKRLWVHFGTQGTACLELDGTVVWTTRELKYVPVHGNGGSPVLVDDVLVVNCDGGDTQSVVALEQATGKIRWKTARSVTPKKGFAFCTPLLIEVNGGRQLVSAGPDAVCAYDPKTGTELWKARYAGGYSVVPRPVYGHGMVYLSTGYDSPRLLAIKVDGQGDVTDTHIAWELKKGAPLNPSPLLVGDEVYVVSDNGIATCLDARTGTQHWQERVGGNYSASPLFAEGRIYVQSEDGVTTVLRAGTKFEELGKSELGERTLASWAVDDTAAAIFLRTEKGLFRIEAGGK